MIKAIIFDFGNVICRFTNEIFLEKVSKLNGKSRDENFELIYKNSGLPKKFETGLISANDFYDQISKLLELNISFEGMQEIYTKDKFTPIEGMDKLIESLKKNYKIGLLSNTSEWDFNCEMKKFPIMNLFDTITISNEVKAMKPNKVIYFDALKKLELKPEECVYVDDILEYVEAGKNLGINSVQFINIDSFITELIKFGVKI